MRYLIPTLFFGLALAGPATAQITTRCIDQKAAEIVSRGLRVADVPVAALIIAEDLCIHTAQDDIDKSRVEVFVSRADAQKWAIKHLTQIARKALLKKMGLVD